MSPSPPARLGARGLAALTAVGATIAGTALVMIPLLSSAAQAAPRSAASASAPRDVIANLFEWNWPSVASECTSVLGPKGYGAVQVAPPEDSIRLAGSTHPWWDVYQPVGYDLNSRMGTSAQFTAMVSACHAAGVKVYADAVLNHTAGSNQTSTDSYGGASFNPATYTYGTIGYGPSNFHGDPPCPNANLGITDWNSVAQVQECQLLGLSDLYTEQDYVRTKLAGYLNTLETAGVDGFRVDAAKHVAQTDMAAILAKVNNTGAGVRPYVYQEIFPGSSGQLAASAFESNGSVLEFNYAYDLKNQFTGSIANLRTFGQSGLEPSAKSAVMVTNHDTERNGSTLNTKSGAAYILAHEFELAFPYGTPQVYSGFDFTSNDQSPPADANGYVTATTCASGWTCLDRNQSVANMVGFHNAVAGTAVGNWYDDGSNLIAFSRGAAGWVSINNESSTATHTYATGLPAGTYCDVIHGDFTGGACTGPTVAVDASGNATVSTAAKDSVALDINAAVTGGGSTTPPTTTPPTTSPSSTMPPGQVAEMFAVSGAPAGVPVYVVGSVPALSNWNPASGLPLTHNGSLWTGTANLPASTAFEYKYVTRDSGGNVTWELDPNHSASTGTAAATLNDTWHGATSTVSATFDATVTTSSGQNVFVVGSIPALGSWNTGNAIALSPALYPVWSAAVSLPANTSFEYKYIKKNSDGTIQWESGANRTAAGGTGGTLTLHDTWK